MKLVVLAGGRGTRISEETSSKPKPMVEIGGQPLLWHILKLYAAHGITDAIICAGYRGQVIKDFFNAYFMRNSDLSFDLRGSSLQLRSPQREAWKVTVVDTGQDTMTGGRLRRVREMLGNERFCLTYGDGVSDVDIGALAAFHEQERALVTLTAVVPPPRFGAVTLAAGSNRIQTFGDTPSRDRSWINGGFFVVEPDALDYIDGDESVWEDALTRLAQEGKLAGYRHLGFWRAMDTLHDKHCLEELWAAGNAPWKNW
jgi:glucose-1-phosphate cytidylyltransferase